MSAPFIGVGVRFQVLAALILSVLAVGASAAPAPQVVPTVNKKTTKTVKMSFYNTSWRAVLEWLSDKDVANKPVVTNYNPAGTFTFIGPPDKEYTIPEVIDIINQALQSNNPTHSYFLINRQRSFTLMPADEIDYLFWPRILPEDLREHGNTEIVSMVLPLSSLDVDAIAPHLKKLMGPFGEAIPMTHTGVNSLILLDSVGNLKRICQLI